MSSGPGRKRALAWPLVACVIAAGLWAVGRGGGAAEDPGPLGTPGAVAPEDFGPGEQTPPALEPVEGDRSPGREEVVAAGPDASTPDAGGGSLVDIFVVDLDGEPLFQRRAGRPTKIEPRVALWLHVAVVPSRTRKGSHVPAAQSVRRGAGVDRTSSRVVDAPGWYGVLPAAADPRSVALLFGDHVIEIATIVPGDSAVTLRVDPLAIPSAMATVRGSVDGVAQAAEAVTIRPARSGAVGFTAPLRSEAPGASFEFTAVPPGEALLVIEPNRIAFAQALMGAARRRGKPLSLGERVHDEADWDARLEALASLGEQPLGRVVLDLAPGEVRDLGVLEVGTAGVVELALFDPTGAPSKAWDAQVTPLLGTTSGLRPAGSSAAGPQVWRLDHRLLLHPVDRAATQFLVSQHEDGCIVTVQPISTARTGELVATDARMTPLSLVRLGEGARLLVAGTDSELPADPRWAGGNLGGQEIGDNDRLVPFGSFDAAFQGGLRRSFTVSSQSLIHVDRDGVRAERL